MPRQTSIANRRQLRQIRIRYESERTLGSANIASRLEEAECTYHANALSLIRVRAMEPCTNVSITFRRDEIGLAREEYTASFIERMFAFLHARSRRKILAGLPNGVFSSRERIKR